MYDRLKMLPGLLIPPSLAIWKSNRRVMTAMPSMTCFNLSHWDTFIHASINPVTGYVYRLKIPVNACVEMGLYVGTSSLHVCMCLHSLCKCWIWKKLNVSRPSLGICLGATLRQNKDSP